MYVQDYANLIKFSLHSTTVTERGSQGAQKMLGIPGSHVVTSLNGNYLVNPTLQQLLKENFGDYPVPH